MTELTPHGSPTFQNHGTNWRRRIREMMVLQNEKTLGFLQKPIGEHPTFGPVETAMRRYALRNTIDSRATQTLHDIFNDIDKESDIQSEIAERLSAHGTSSLQEIQSQCYALFELYKEVGEKLMESENQLKMRMEKIDKLQARVANLMELNSNAALPSLMEALEKYLSVAFNDLQIEQLYKEVLLYYKKHSILRESMQVLRIGSNTSDPLCAICFQDPIQYCHTPCGHTYCSHCSRRQSMQCAICRTPTRDRVKIYFS
jgi:hypothetical protein